MSGAAYDQEGPRGRDGSAGANGTNGNTVLYGSGAPSNGTGVNGDFYINTATNYIYGPKASGVWPSGTSLIGPQGAAGTNGTNGTNGAAGADAGPYGLASCNAWSNSGSTRYLVPGLGFGSISATIKSSPVGSARTVSEIRAFANTAVGAGNYIIQLHKNGSAVPGFVGTFNGALTNPPAVTGLPSTTFADTDVYAWSFTAGGTLNWGDASVWMK